MSNVKSSYCAVLAVVGIALLAALGCDSSGGKSSGGASMDQMANAIDAQKEAKKRQEEAVAAKAAADQKATQDAANAQAQAPKIVGGREKPAFGGYFGAIAGARRHVMNVVDSIAWIQGVRSFKAEEGRKPKDNSEFMTVVVPKYELQLPRIEEDEEYLYDPNGETDGDFGQLYIVKKGTPPEAGPATAPEGGAK